MFMSLVLYMYWITHTNTNFIPYWTTHKYTNSIPSNNINFYHFLTLYRVLLNFGWIIAAFTFTVTVANVPWANAREGAYVTKADNIIWGKKVSCLWLLNKRTVVCYMFLLGLQKVVNNWRVQNISTERIPEKDLYEMTDAWQFRYNDHVFKSAFLQKKELFTFTRYWKKKLM